MKTFALVFLLVFSTAALSAPSDCPLQGTWKSDAARTLADIAARDAASGFGMRAVRADLFGHMIHEWSCVDHRAWFDFQVRPVPTPYRIAELSSDSVLVVFPGAPDADLRLTFEGDCYKMYFEHMGFYEYFCPVEKP